MHRSTFRGLFAAAAAATLGAHSAFAQNIMDTASNVGDGRARLGGALSMSEITYEGDHDTFDVDRTTLGAVFDYGITREVDLTAQLGYIVETEIEDVDKDGDGITFGLGVRATVHRLPPKGRIGIYGLFDTQNEEVKSDGNKYKLNTSELHLGGIFAYAITQKIEPYAGLELVAHDDGEIKVTTPVGHGTNDIDRDDIVNLKIGITAALGSADLRGELTVLGEQTFTLGVGMYL